MKLKASLQKTMGLSGWRGSVTIIGIRVVFTAAKKMSDWPECGWRASAIGGDDTWERVDFVISCVSSAGSMPIEPGQVPPVPPA